MIIASYNQGVVNQETYSVLGCAANATPKGCTANTQIIAGFIGVILSLIGALFGASLVIPPAIMKIINKIKRITERC